ncbi:MAG: DUF7123 family protein [Natronomonas sp.]
MSTNATVSQSAMSRKATRLAEFLRDEAEATTGDLYVKSKFISDDVGMSPKEIGALMGQVDDGATGMNVQKWSYTSATTWRISIDS